MASCQLYAGTTQAVFGEGDPGAEVVLIGEQPGDREDREGRPFVGPAGRLLDRALVDAGIDRDRTYLTNVVKHFSFRQERGGKRRIHKKPSRTEIIACLPWLNVELEQLRSRVLVTLGATAGQALLGSDFRLRHHHGVELPAHRLRDLVLPQAASDLAVVATRHPSSALRAPDRDAVYAELVSDLDTVADLVR